MQGRENAAESRLHLAMARAIYPGNCGYSSETGGIMKNLRESCNNVKVFLNVAHCDLVSQKNFIF